MKDAAALGPGLCPICKVALSIKDMDGKYDIKYCSSCKREFWPMKEESKNFLEEQSDLETVSTESGSSFPVLLSDEMDYKGFPESRKKKDYLQEFFGSHVKITSRVDNPT